MLNHSKFSAESDYLERVSGKTAGTLFLCRPSRRHKMKNTSLPSECQHLHHPMPVKRRILSLKETAEAYGPSLWFWRQRIWAGDIQFIQCGRKQLLDRLDIEKFLESQLSMLHEAYAHAFVDLGVVTDEGVQIAYAGPFKLREANYSNALWFKQAIAKDYYISDVFKGLRGLPHFIITVRQKSKGRTWILRATVDFEAFNSLVQKIKIGATGFAFVVNQHAELQTMPRYDMRPISHLYTELAKSSNSWGSGVRLVEKKNDLGDPTLYTMSRLKEGNWLLIYQQSAKDAFSVLHRARTVAAGIFAAAVTSIVFVTILIARNMVHRISEADLQREMMNEKVIEAGKLASIGELAAGIAHEINNPVAIMVEEAGWIEDLLQEESMASCHNLTECLRAVNQIRQQGKRCKQITHKLLSFARKTDPVERKVQLNEIITEVVGLSQQRAKYGNITLTTSLTSDLPEVTVSPSEMQQSLFSSLNQRRSPSS